MARKHQGNFSLMPYRVNGNLQNFLEVGLREQFLVKVWWRNFPLPMNTRLERAFPFALHNIDRMTRGATGVQGAGASAKIFAHVHG